MMVVPAVLVDELACGDGCRCLLGEWAGTPGLGWELREEVALRGAELLDEIASHKEFKKPPDLGAGCCLPIRAETALFCCGVLGVRVS